MNKTHLIKMVISLLESIDNRLAGVAPRDELLDYRAAANRLGISERKLSDLVIRGRLIEGLHYLRIDGCVRFPADVARRFMKVAPKQTLERQPCNPAPKKPHRLNRPTGAPGEPPRRGIKSQFNLDY